MVLNFFKNSFFYLLILLTERTLIFFISPYLISVISKTDFGKYSLFLTFESAIMPLITLNLYSAISKEYYDDNYNFKKSTFLLIVTYFILSIFSTTILTMVNYFFPSLFIINFKASLLAIFTGLLSSLLIYFQTYLKLKNYIFQFAVLSISQSLLYFGVILFVTKNIYLDVNILFYSRFILFFIMVLVVLLLTRNVIYTNEYKLLINSLKLTIPTVVFSFSAFVFVMSDRFFISKYLGIATLGEYAAIYQIPALLSLVTGAFSTAWIPWLYENLKNSTLTKRIYLVKVIYFLVFLLIIGSILFYFLLPFIGNLLFKGLINFNVSYIKYLVLGFFFQGVYNLVSPLVFYSGKTKFHAYIGILVAFVSVISNFILIPIIGLKGASITFCASWFLLSFLFFVATFYSYRMPWFYFKNILHKKCS
jgi:O-antigen/teichoic acid export membrane protein